MVSPHRFTPGLNGGKGVMNLNAWRYYASLYKRLYRPLILSLVFSIGQSLLVLPIAFLVRHAFDVVIPAGDLHRIVLIGATILILHCVSNGLALWIRHVTLKTTKLVIRDVRDQLIRTLLGFSRTFYDEADSGTLHTTVVQDTQRLDVMSNALVAQLTPAVLVSLALTSVLIYLNWMLFLVVLGVVPFFFIVNRCLGRSLRHWVRRYHHSFEQFSKGILSVFKRIDLIRFRSADRIELERQRDFFEQLRLTSQKMAWVRAAYNLLQNTNVMLIGVVVLIVGGGSVAAGTMTLGDLLSFYAALGLIRPHLYMISFALPSIFEGNESLIRLHRLLMTDHSGPYTGTDMFPFTGSVRLESVDFDYTGTDVLHDVSLSIQPDTTHALYGPNGSGKTTIAHLILGFYRPRKGRLSADDHPYDDIDLADMRRQIGVIMQNPVIFSGTILENITYGSPGADHHDVLTAARLAAAHQFIDRLPEKYETMIGEDGTTLSGRECQRIALARALLRVPKLLILDEPTNHLDAESIRTLLDGLKRLPSRPAILIISHDVNVVRMADRVHVLDAGRIISSGDPASHIAEIDAE